jgi:hypothetical protein
MTQYIFADSDGMYGMYGKGKTPKEALDMYRYIAGGTYPTDELDLYSVTPVTFEVEETIIPKA